MKLLFLLLTSLVLMGCENQPSAYGNEINSAQPGSTTTDSSNASQNRMPYEEYKVDEAQRRELESESEKFKQVPDEFKDVDFRNFKYLKLRLKNGGYNDFNAKNPLAGHQSFLLDDVFYIDLNGDYKKEAIVFIGSVSCGVSCDGGREIIYFYSSEKGKARFLDLIETGANAGGCSLKAFIVKNKKITLEQFGRCLKDSSLDENKEYFCKFCVKDETQTVYTLDKSGLKKESSAIIETGQINVMNSAAIIGISD